VEALSSPPPALCPMCPCGGCAGVDTTLAVPWDKAPAVLNLGHVLTQAVDVGRSTLALPAKVVILGQETVATVTLVRRDGLPAQVGPECVTVTATVTPPPALAASPAVHHGFVCDDCNVQPIVGDRYRSVGHPDMDLCSACCTRRGGPRLGWLPVPAPPPGTAAGAGTEAYTPHRGRRGERLPRQSVAFMKAMGVCPPKAGVTPAPATAAAAPAATELDVELEAAIAASLLPASLAVSVEVRRGRGAGVFALALTPPVGGGPGGELALEVRVAGRHVRGSPAVLALRLPIAFDPTACAGGVVSHDGSTLSWGTSGHPYGHPLTGRTGMLRTGPGVAFDVVLKVSVGASVAQVTINVGAAPPATPHHHRGSSTVGFAYDMHSGTINVGAAPPATPHHHRGSSTVGFAYDMYSGTINGMRNQTTGYSFPQLHSANTTTVFYFHVRGNALTLSVGASASGAVAQDGTSWTVPDEFFLSLTGAGHGYTFKVSME
jgi:hypothetical protein